MSRTFATPSHSLAISMVAAVILLASCGAPSRPTIETASAGGTAASAAVPVVATTAPILLPPEDVELPAEAPVEVQLTMPLPTAVAAVEVTASPEPEAANAHADAAAVEVQSDQQTSAAAADTANEALVAPVVAAVQSAASWNPCIVEAAQRVGASSLLDPIAGATTTDLTSHQLNALAAASVDCGLVAESLSLTDLADHLAAGANCMNQWLESSGGGSVLAGLASVGFGHATPAWAQGHFTSSIAACFVGASFAAEVLDDVAADSSIGAAFDATCLANSFDASGVIYGYAAALASTPDAAGLSISLDDAWVLNCASVGTIVASAAAAEGVALSASTVACLDAEFRAAGLVSGIIDGTADTEAVGLSTIACLSNEEAALILG